MTSQWIDLLDLAEALRFRTKDRHGFSRRAAEEWLKRTNQRLAREGRREILTRYRGQGGSTVLILKSDLDRPEVMAHRTGDATCAR